jgi:cyclophilin family peptidyl-prolyl cis-trans isomerase
MYLRMIALVSLMGQLGCGGTSGDAAAHASSMVDFSAAADSGVAADSANVGVDARSGQVDAFIAQDANSSALPDSGREPAPTGIQVEIRTTLGAFTVALNSEAAPNTVANFLSYVDSGFYDGQDGRGATIFHRVMTDFMIQGGGVLANGMEKPTQGPIAHESPNGLLNLRGAISMARTMQPNTAASQFFVNHRDNAFLDYADPQNPGYVVFGQVVDGMDVVDAIATTATNAMDVPVMTITIEAVSRL